MDELPSDILSRCDSVGLVPKEIIFKNSRKERYNLIATTETSNPVFVKAIGSEAPAVHAENFEKEVAFYKNSNRSGVIPSYIESGSDLLVLEYLDADSLRYWIDDYLDDKPTDTPTAQFETVVENLTQGLTELYFDLSILPPPVSEDNRPGNSDTELFVSHLTGNCARLFSSGPMNTSRGRVDETVSSLLRPLYLALFRRAVATKIAEQPYSPELQPVHGDLHQDNILVSTDDSVAFVDWENYRYGFWIDDIAFLTAALFALLRNRPNHYRYVRSAISNVVTEHAPEAAPLFEWVLTSMERIVSTNRRFHRTCTNWQVISGGATVLTQMLEMMPAVIHND